MAPLSSLLVFPFENGVAYDTLGSSSRRIDQFDGFANDYPQNFPMPLSKAEIQPSQAVSGPRVGTVTDKLRITISAI